MANKNLDTDTLRERVAARIRSKLLQGLSFRMRGRLSSIRRGGVALSPTPCARVSRRFSAREFGVGEQPAAIELVPGS